MFGSPFGEFVDVHRLADEGSSAYVKTDESAARVSPV
jgi:hypothetical protein